MMARAFGPAKRPELLGTFLICANFIERRIGANKPNGIHRRIKRNDGLALGAITVNEVANEMVRVPTKQKLWPMMLFVLNADSSVRASGYFYRYSVQLFKGLKPICDFLL